MLTGLGSEFRVQGVGFKVAGAGFRIKVRVLAVADFRDSSIGFGV